MEPPPPSPPHTSSQPPPSSSSEMQASLPPAEAGGSSDVAAAVAQQQQQQQQQYDTGPSVDRSNFVRFECEEPAWLAGTALKVRALCMCTACTLHALYAPCPCPCTLHVHMRVHWTCAHCARACGGARSRCTRACSTPPILTMADGDVSTYHGRCMRACSTTMTRCGILAPVSAATPRGSEACPSGWQRSSLSPPRASLHAASSSSASPSVPRSRNSPVRSEYTLSIHLVYAAAPCRSPISYHPRASHGHIALHQPPPLCPPGIPQRIAWRTSIRSYYHAYTCSLLGRRAGREARCTRTSRASSVRAPSTSSPSAPHPHSRARPCCRRRRRRSPAGGWRHARRRCAPTAIVQP